MAVDGIQQAVDDFWEVFPAYWHRVRGYIRQVALEGVGISVEQFHILRHVSQGRDTVSQLADVKRISRPAISQAVQALVDKGLILRSRHSRDRRRIQLSLTRAGEDLLGSIFDQTRAWMKESFSKLPAADLEAISGALAALKKIQES